MRITIVATALVLSLIVDQVRTGGYYRREVLIAIERNVPGTGRVVALLY